MELNAKEVLKIIKSKGVDSLYHANTVQTACTFLSQGQLMARGVVDDMGLSQTSQQTDALDKKYGLWYDIFLDGVDIHERVNHRCFYGPVLFIFDIELFSEEWLSLLWITKMNPQHWTDTQTVPDRYFSTIAEVQQKYRKGNFDSSFVLRHIGGTFPLKPYLKKIIIDNPHYVSNGVQLFSQAIGALKASARFGALANVEIEQRTCKNRCGCQAQYEQMSKKVLNLFFAP